MSAPPATHVAQATHVAHKFVKQYYSMLTKNPDQLYKLYKAHSVFSFSRGNHGGGAASTVSAVGPEQIHNQIMATLRPFNGRPCRTEIVALDAQESRQGGVLILVTCYLIITGTPMTQHFTQSFFLDKQTEPQDGYYVLTDILRYLPVTVATAVPPQPGNQGPIMVPNAFFHGGMVQPGARTGESQAQPHADQMHPPAMQVRPQQPAAAQQQSQPWPQTQSDSPPPQQMQPVMPPYSGPAPYAASVPGADVHFQGMAFVPAQPPAHGDAFVAVPPPGPAGPALADGSPHQSAEGDKGLHQEQERPEDAEQETRAASKSMGMNLKEREEALKSQEQRLLEVEQDLEYHDEDEVDERVAVVSLDFEEEEEEEDDAQDEEVEENEDGQEPASADKQKSFDFDSELTKMEAPRNEGEQPPSATATDEQGPCEEPSVEPPSSKEAADGEEPLAEFLLEEPPTWASMAGRLQQGGGQLGPSKMQGFGCPAAPPPKAPANVYTASSGSTSSTAPAAATAQSKSGQVWIWVSRLPNDPIADSNEVLEGLNAKLVELGTEGRAVEADRRDPLQEWASVLVTSQEAADTLVTLSKDRRLLLRGKPLKAEPYRTTFSSRRQGRGGGGAVAARAAAAGSGGREEERSAAGDGRGGSKFKRRVRGSGA